MKIKEVFCCQAVSNEGERNNERNIVSRRENPPNYTRQDTGSGADSHLSRPVANKRDDRNNRNNNKQNDTRGLVNTEGKVGTCKSCMHSW